MQVWISSLIAAISVVVASIFAGLVYDKIRLGRRKKGVSRDMFIAEFEKRDVPREVSCAVYDFYRRNTGIDSFKVAPDDSLLRVYLASHDEIDEAAVHILESLGLELPSEAVLRRHREPLVTVQDMVLWINWVRKGAPSEDSDHAP